MRPNAQRDIRNPRSFARGRSQDRATSPAVNVPGDSRVNDRLGLLAAPERRTDPRDQLGRREGLDDVVGRARIERLGDGLFAAVGGDEDDRQVGEVRDLGHQLDAVDLGQHQVEQDQPRPLGADDAWQVLQHAGQERGVTGLGERVADEAQRPRVVVHDQDPGRVAGSRGGRRRGGGNRRAGLPGHRQREGERGAAAGARALGPDAAAVRLDETLRDGEPEGTERTSVIATDVALTTGATRWPDESTVVLARSGQRPTTVELEALLDEALWTPSCDDTVAGREEQERFEDRAHEVATNLLLPRAEAVDAQVRRRCGRLTALRLAVGERLRIEIKGTGDAKQVRTVVERIG